MSNAFHTGRLLAAAPQVIDAASYVPSPRPLDVAYASGAGGTARQHADAAESDWGVTEFRTHLPSLNTHMDHAEVSRSAACATPLDAASLASRLQLVRDEVDAGAQQVRCNWDVRSLQGLEPELEQNGTAPPTSTPPRLGAEMRQQGSSCTQMSGQGGFSLAHAFDQMGFNRNQVAR